MLGLLVLGLVAHALQPQVVPLGFRTLFSGKDRSSMFIDIALDKRAQVLVTIVSVSILAMAIYVTLVNVLSVNSFHIVPYLYIVLLSLAMVLLRSVVQTFIGYTFFSRGALDTFMGHYYYLSACTTIVLYPVVLVSLFFPLITPKAIVALNGAVFAFYLLILLVKCALILVRSVRGFFYIILYIFTIEVIPTLLLVYASYLLINN